MQDSAKNADSRVLSFEVKKYHFIYLDPKKQAIDISFDQFND